MRCTSRLVRGLSDGVRGRKPGMKSSFAFVVPRQLQFLLFWTSQQEARALRLANEIQYMTMPDAFLKVRLYLRS